MSKLSSLTRLPCGNRVLDLSRPQVMGILNVTPDSFSDGGSYTQRTLALRHAQAMVDAGATLIDVGGESTRPGARPVSPTEEIERVAPIVEALAAELDVVISVDTSTPAVIREAARLGAGLDQRRALAAPRRCAGCGGGQRYGGLSDAHAWRAGKHAGEPAVLRCYAGSGGLSCGDAWLSVYRRGFQNSASCWILDSVLPRRWNII